MRKIKSGASIFYMKQAVRISAKNEGVRKWAEVERVDKCFEWSISEKSAEKKKSTECPMKITNLSGFGLSTFFSRNMLPRSTGCKNNGPITQKLRIIFKKSGLLWWLSGEESTYQSRRHGCNPWSMKIPYATEQLSLGTITIEPVL